MLADFLAATATSPPTPAVVHDAYDWWSDIWLPAIVGAGSIAAAAAAVFIARRSNKFAAVSTRAAERATEAAERANQLAAQALEHEQEQANRTAEIVEAERRSRFADRVTARFDLFLTEREHETDDYSRHVPEIGTLALESIASGWRLDLNAWVQEALRHDHSDPEEREFYHSDLRQAIHTTMASWVRDSAGFDSDSEYFKKQLHEEYPDPVS